MSPRLSKSRFLAGAQCTLRLWYEAYARELAAAPDAMLEQVFATGRAVGALARERFPGGVLVDADHRHPADALAATRRLLADAAVPALYEAAFEHEGVLVRADVLVRAGDGWDLVEVKSTTGVKAVHDLDVAVQAWVLRGAGLALRRAGVLTLDRGYVWPGGAYDLQALFRLHDRGDAVAALLPDIGPEVARLHAVLAAGRAPDVAPGAQCAAPYACPFLAHCTRDVEAPEWPVTVLPNLREPRRAALEALGVEDVREVPADFELNGLQSVVRDATVRGADVVHGDLAAAIAPPAWPVLYLDFETAAAALPWVPGTRPYDAVPFQFSLHGESRDGTVWHVEHLHRDAGDPRPALARALLDAAGEHGAIAVYSSYEKRVIGELAAALPELSAPLAALLPRLWDLLPVVRGNYYHPAFRGSFSIKSVLPALAPALAYDDLAIRDGGLAAARWLQALAMDDGEARDAVFADLREYCARDTLGLLHIRRALAARAGAPAPPGAAAAPPGAG